MIRKMRKRTKTDRGDSELVSLLILLPIVLGILFTMIDSSVYFANRAQMQAAARDGARTVAIMGGDGTPSRATPIEKRYGVTKAQACKDLDKSPVTAAVYAAKGSQLTPIECQVLQSYSTAGLVSVEVTNVVCGPQRTVNVGAKTECTVDWAYSSIPGSTLGFIKIGKENTTKGSAESEVDLRDVSLVDR